MTNNPLPEWIRQAKANDEQIGDAMALLEAQISLKQTVWDAARDLRATSLKALAKSYDKEHTAIWADQLLHSTGQMHTIGDELYRMRCSMAELRHAALSVANLERAEQRAAMNERPVLS